ncbi:MAG: endo-1,4-beta-xylanase [Acaryochloridaceae cyanobacterium CSU_3_4]|nr:endo-1,4-beta-xylanase [Acaryochloridaceae cyanobacterium CSU_3_4]
MSQPLSRSWQRSLASGLFAVLIISPCLGTGCSTFDSARLSSAEELQTQPLSPLPLRALAQQRRLQIGTAVQVKPLQQEAPYRQILAREFNQLTTENAMKFRVIHPEPDRYDFTDADQIVGFAQTHRMAVHGHPLVWYRTQPDWLTQGQWTRQTLMPVLKDHIRTVVRQYRGRVQSWDVVNEAIDDQGNLRDNLWLRVIGPEYIAIAFQEAHAADPKARLFYNDYGGEEVGKKSDAIYDLVKTLRDQGVPIHGVGLQMHKTIKRPLKFDRIHENFQRLQALELDVRITEMDVQIHGGQGNLTQKLHAQAQVYQKILKLCLNAPNCKALTVWGLSDQHSWIPEFFKRSDAPLLFDSVYQPKPAYNALKALLQ